MKSIPKIDLPGAVTLTPMEMNKIHLETGKHSPVKPASDPVSHP